MYPIDVAALLLLGSLAWTLWDKDEANAGRLLQGLPPFTLERRSAAPSATV